VTVRVVAATASTNEDMLADARTGAPHGCWLRADRQEGGRGRAGRSWSSPPGNLYASTLVRLAPTDPPAAGLALVAGVAVQEVVAVYAADASIRLKWPNDLMAGRAKLAGILLEREGDAVVIGIGANLRSHPQLPDRQTTDLLALSGAAPTPDAFLAELAPGFARWLGRWRGEGLEPIRRRWLERAHPVGSALSISGAGEPLVGAFDGLEPDGGLRLRRADGTIRIVRAGDVDLI